MKSLIKFFAIALAVSIALVSFSVTVGAEGDTLQITVDNVDAYTGDSADVNLCITSNPGFVSLLLTVTYGEGLTLTSVDNGQIVDGYASEPDNYVSPYTLCWDNDLLTANITVTGTLATLHFDVASDADGEIPVIVACDNDNDGCFDTDLQKVPVAITAGSVTASPKPHIDVTGVTLDSESATIMAGEIKQLVATVQPSNATDKTVTWSSNNELVAIVDSDGIVSALKAGVAVITATTNESSFTASCIIAVGYAITNGTTVSDKETNNGYITVAGRACAGDTVTVNPFITKGYQVSAIYLNENAVEPENGIFSFTMPEGDVTVSAEFEAADEAVAEATYNAVISLADNIDMTLKMKNIGGAEALLLSVYVDGEVADMTLKDGVAVTKLSNIIPEEIGKAVRIVYEYDGYVVNSYDYSVESYCRTVLKMDAYKDGAFGTLCKAVLNYGACAENLYNEQNGIDAISTVNTGFELDFDDITVSADYDEESVNDTTYILQCGASLDLQSNISLIFTVYSNKKLTKDNIFVLNEKDTPEKIGASQLTVTSNGNVYTITVSGLYASQLATKYTFKIKGVDLDVFSFSYGVFSYCYNMVDLGSDTFSDFCKALYNYGLAARAYATK